MIYIDVPFEDMHIMYHKNVPIVLTFVSISVWLFSGNSMIADDQLQESHHPVDLLVPFPVFSQYLSIRGPRNAL